MNAARFEALLARLSWADLVLLCTSVGVRHESPREELVARLVSVHEDPVVARTLAKEAAILVRAHGVRVPLPDLESVKQDLTGAMDAAWEEHVRAAADLAMMTCHTPAPPPSPATSLDSPPLIHVPLMYSPMGVLL